MADCKSTFRLSEKSLENSRHITYFPRMLSLRYHTDSFNSPFRETPREQEPAIPDS